MKLMLASDLDLTLLKQHSQGDFKKRNCDDNLIQNIIHREEIQKLIIENPDLVFAIHSNGLNAARVKQVYGILHPNAAQCLVQSMMLTKQEDFLVRLTEKDFFEGFWERDEKQLKKYLKEWNVEKIHQLSTILENDLPKNYLEILKSKIHLIDFTKEGAGKNMHIANLVMMYLAQHPNELITEIIVVDDDQKNIDALEYFERLATLLGIPALKNIKITPIHVLFPGEGYFFDDIKEAVEDYLQRNNSDDPLDERKALKSSDGRSGKLRDSSESSQSQNSHESDEGREEFEDYTFFNKAPTKTPKFQHTYKNSEN